MKTPRRVLRVDRHEIHYLRTTLESYSGMALVRTLDPWAAYIEILISPGCEKLVDELLHSLSKDEGLMVEETDA
jgi:hypothetical protein